LTACCFLSILATDPDDSHRVFLGDCLVHTADNESSLTALRRGLAVAVALQLSSPALASSAQASDEAEAWRQYARSSFQLAVDPSLSQLVPDQVAATSQPLPERGALGAAAGRLALSVRAATTSGGPFAADVEDGFRFQPAGPSVDFSGSRFTSSLLSPELQAQIGAGSAVKVGLTIANQRFATPGFGEVRAHGSVGPIAQLTKASAGARVEQSFGHGVHLGIESELGNQMTFGLALQSRVDMDAFKTYRGIFTEPGDFDVPARTAANLAYRASPGMTLRAAAERVFYSEVNAFTSSALPPSFLAFLGDGSSPRFAWRDLNVYSLAAELADRWEGRWGLKVSSRQQPSPTSPLLDLALRDSYKGTHFAASYQRELGAGGMFNLGASYAPSQYVLGFSPFGNRYRDGSQLEVEMNWIVAF